MYNVLASLFASQQHDRVVNSQHFIGTVDIFNPHAYGDDIDDRVQQAGVILMKTSEFHARFYLDEFGAITLTNRTDPLWLVGDASEEQEDLLRAYDILCEYDEERSESSQGALSN